MSDNFVDTALIKNFFRVNRPVNPRRVDLLNGKSHKVVLASTDLTHYVCPPFTDDEALVKIV